MAWEYPKLDDGQQSIAILVEEVCQREIGKKRDIVVEWSFNCGHLALICRDQWSNFVHEIGVQYFPATSDQVRRVGISCANRFQETLNCHRKGVKFNGRQHHV